VDAALDEGDEGNEGRPVRLTLRINDQTSIVRPENVFIQDARSGKTFAAEAMGNGSSPAAASSSDYSFSVTIPAAQDVPTGKYDYKVIIIDEAGNLRQSTHSYTR
jgi:hypothetical protein